LLLSSIGMVAISELTDLLRSAEIMFDVYDKQVTKIALTERSKIVL